MMGSRRAPRARSVSSPLRHIMALVLLTAALALGGARVVPADEARPLPSQTDEYRIGPLDKLDINVFQVKDLTLDKVQVDASGHILLPLIGLLEAKGKTAGELSAEIAKRLDANYMQNAQVSVVVDEAQSQKITVGGAVTEAGVFQLHGPASLLQAIAMAKGPSKTGDLKHVTVFRTVDGAAAPEKLDFDAVAIEKGKAQDPPVFGNDVVMVAESGTKNMFQNVLVPMAPLVYLLTLIH